MLDYTSYIMLKRFLKLFYRFIIVIFCLVLLYFVVGYILSQVEISEKERGTSSYTSIYIKTNGKHTDIVLPVKNDVIDWAVELPYYNNISQDTVYSYLAIGWGDKGFFLDMPTWDDLTFSLAFKAAFWLGETAMHVTYYKEMEESEDCVKIEVSREQYVDLVSFVKSKFQIDSSGDFINIKTDAAYGLTDAFYEAKGKYSIFNSCNTWANEALAACGQKHCLWTFFDDPIFEIYRENRK